MNSIRKKYGIIVKAVGIALILLVIRLIIDMLNYDVISLKTVLDPEGKAVLERAERMLGWEGEVAVLR